VAADIERAATARGRGRLGCYSIEGLRLHERALRAGVPVRRALLGRGLREQRSTRVRELVEGLARAGCELRDAPDAVLAKLTGGREVGAILGLVPIPRPPALSDLVRGAAADRVTLLVAVDVDDPGNVGALVRTALASGSAAFVSAGPGDPYHPRAVRTSMGSLFRLPLLSYEDAGGLDDDLRRAGFRTVGATSRGGRPLPRADLSHPRIALFVGSEAFGLPAAVVERLDDRVTIPMGSSIDSYSVNAAAAILLWAIGQAR
jgi:TrmH family RNA methyltransferase